MAPILALRATGAKLGEAVFAAAGVHPDALALLDEERHLDRHPGLQASPLV